MAGGRVVLSRCIGISFQRLLGCQARSVIDVVNLTMKFATFVLKNC